MTIKIQKTIKFINDCNCIVDYGILEKAILWYQKRPTASVKHIYLTHGYATVSIHDKKIFIHRLIYMYLNNKHDIKRPNIIHHIDGNRLNNNVKNLEMMLDSKHQSIHAKGRPLTETQKTAIIERNKNVKIVKRNKNGTIAKNGVIYEGEIK